MASTRNNNTPGNYSFQQRAYDEARNYLTYTNSPNGYAYQTCFPGDGLLAGQVPWNRLSRNAADIESHLWGVGSTNLVQPLPSLVPDLRDLPSANIYEKPDVIFMPEPLVVEAHQRPLPIEK
jgi:hypothetical protein